MKGELIKTNMGWSVKYINQTTKKEDFLPLHPADVINIEIAEFKGEDVDARIAANPIVDFDVFQVKKEDLYAEGEYVSGWIADTFAKLNTNIF